MADPLPSIGDIKDMMAEMAQTAQATAHFMETERPYSSPPPAMHPVWADALRAETMALRQEGLVPDFAWHPWETDPQSWPSDDPTTQAALLEGVAARKEWEAFAAEEGITLQEGTPFDVRGEHVLTAVDMIKDFGHQPFPAVPEPSRTADHTLSPVQTLLATLRTTNALQTAHTVSQDTDLSY